MTYPPSPEESGLNEHDLGGTGMAGRGAAPSTPAWKDTGVQNNYSGLRESGPLVLAQWQTYCVIWDEPLDLPGIQQSCCGVGKTHQNEDGTFVLQSPLQLASSGPPTSRAERDDGVKAGHRGLPYSTTCAP